MRVILNQVDRFLSAVFLNQYASSAIILFLILYASLVAPVLPPFIAGLFENPFFKFIFLFLIPLALKYSPAVSLLATVALLVSLQTLTCFRMASLATAWREQRIAFACQFTL